MSYSKFIKIIKFTSSQKTRHHGISPLSASQPRTIENLSLVQDTHPFCGISVPLHKIKVLSHSKHRTNKSRKKQIAARGTRLQYLQ